MRIALAQINSTLGDFEANRIKILDFTKRAAEAGCDLVVFPEHALVGYLPNDLLERHSIIDEQLRELRRLEKEIPKGIAAFVGCVTRATTAKGKLEDSLANKSLYNSAALIEHSKPTRIFNKERLPTYDVFDEARHLIPGSVAKGRIKLRTKSGTYGVQVTICEDIWGWGDPQNAMKKIPRSGHDVVINLSASPFTKTKREKRLAVLKQTAEHFRAPVVYVNMVGAQDEIVFDGRSLVVDKKGRPLGELAAFKEDLAIFDLESGKLERVETAEEKTSPEKSVKTSPRAAKLSAKDTKIETLRQALVLGIRDFALKTGLRKVHFGLSGGIDSALVACLAVDALGADAVTALTLPGPYNDPKSREWAERLAKNLKIRCLNMDIGGPFDALTKSFETGAGKMEFGLVHENIQARVRGVLLMAFSNKEGSLLLSTGNKAEYAAGYSTLYGDQCGGLAPLGDLLKGEVYALSRHYNLTSEVIPHEIIDRAPSAELRPNQKDQDSLPPYDELDSAVERVIEHRLPARTKTEQFVLNASLKSEFKRWQAPPILKVSDHAFGRGRRLPIAHKARQ